MGIEILWIYHGKGRQMQGNILKLYPQYSENTDRRQDNKPVSIERRVLPDRRTSLRFADNEIKTEIIDVQETFRDFIEPINSRHINIESEQKKKRTLEKTKIVCNLCSPFIPARRVSSVPDNIENKDYSKAAGLVAVAAVLLPEDLRDMKDAWNQVVHGKMPKYDYANCQAPFRFLRGTLLEPVINKLGKWGYYLHKFDKSIAETKAGKYLRKLLGVEFGTPELTGRQVPVILKEGNKYSRKLKAIYAQKLEGSFILQVFYRAMQRTTVIGMGILFALWIPSILKSFNKPKETKNKFINAGKQTAKAVINNFSVILGIGLFGALGARKGPAYSVLGMGIGSVLGSTFASKLSKKITIND